MSSVSHKTCYAMHFTAEQKSNFTIIPLKPNNKKMVYMVYAQYNVVPH